MSEADVLKEQRNLLRHVDRVVRRLRLVRRHYGTMATCDVSAMVMERLLRRATYRQTFATEPMRLRGLISYLARHQLTDLARARGAQRRRSPPMVRDHEEQTPCPRATAAHPGLVRALGDALAQFRGSVRTPSAPTQSEIRRAQMVDVFEEHAFLGKTCIEIAKEKKLAKSTVASWVHCVKDHVAKQLREEYGHLL